MTTFGCEIGWLPLLLEISPDKAAPMAATAQTPELGGMQLRGGAAARIETCRPSLTSISKCLGGTTNAPERRANDTPRAAAPKASRAELLDIAFFAMEPRTQFRALE